MVKNKDGIELKLKRPDEFFTNPECFPSTLSEDVRRKLDEEEGLIDPYTLRQMQDWSYLNSKIVGAEYDS